MKRWPVLLLLAFLLGCSPRTNPNEPPPILYGQDACDQCRMIINEPAFASAYRLPDGTARRFDDIGCMIRFLQEQGEQPAHLWVHDYDTEAWIDARTAYYVRTPRVVTPMAYGLLAVASQQRAAQLADSLEGEILTFDTLLTTSIQPLTPTQ